MSERSGKIAVIGMSGAFPGARTIDELWHGLCQGKEMIRRLDNAPADRDASAGERFVPPRTTRSRTGPDSVTAVGRMASLHPDVRVQVTAMRSALRKTLLLSNCMKPPTRASPESATRWVSTTPRLLVRQWRNCVAPPPLTPPSGSHAQTALRRSN